MSDEQHRQEPLFDTGAPITRRTEYEITRPTDPETSLEAAETVVPKLREYQEQVLAVVCEGPGTHNDFIERFKDRHGYVSFSGVRTRVRELCDAGFVEDTGRRAQLAESGRNAVVWAATERGKAYEEGEDV